MSKFSFLKRMFGISKAPPAEDGIVFDEDGGVTIYPEGMEADESDPLAELAADPGNREQFLNTR